MEMGSRYKFSEEEIRAIEQARKQNKDKNIERRLKALEMRAKGLSLKEIAEVTGYHENNTTRLVAKYRANGLEAISEKHYKGNRRNISVEEEAALLKPFKICAEKGELVEISEIKAAYEQAVGHTIGTGQIYKVLKRHNWRKVMPRSKHPKSANSEAIEASKKLKQKQMS